jgi:presequence protease
MKKKAFHINDTYKNFIVTKSLPIDEIRIHLVEMTHKPTGAQVLHLEAEDEENLFSLSFRTLPKDSKGAPHILEHIVLCGSKKFPVKDPFFSMRKRSLHTFMNAMTGADFTCYPASSQVEKDFYNLLSVYLDAVFFPEIKPLSFLQEGHRFEFTHPKDPSSPLLFKGVVYNEMKGAMNQPDSRLWHEMMKHLLPDLPYAHNSGGDPKEIPLLTYKELLEFHQTYYHPSNCLFFFYGNLPLENHLDFIENQVLNKMSQRPSIPLLPKQKRFLAPKEVKAFYPFQESESLQKKDFLSFAWLTCPLMDQETQLALSLLDSLLMDTDASPLKSALLESNLCQEATSSLDVEMSEIPWILTCKGCNESDQAALWNLIVKTLTTLAKEGFSKELQDASLHQLEFERLEISSGDGPWGLSLFMRSALFKQHGGKSEDALSIHSLFNRLRKKLQNSSYLPSLIDTYFLKNPHQVSLCLSPDRFLLQKEEQEEKKQLETIQKKLSEEEKKKIIEESVALLAYQEEMERHQVNLLPKISQEEIPRKIKDYPLKQKEINNTKIYYHNVFTNDLLYADWIFDLPHLEKEELSLLPFFMAFLTEVGVKNGSYKSQLEKLQSYTGGIAAFAALHIQTNNPHSFLPSFGIKGKALGRNSEKLLKIFEETLFANFHEKERVQQLLLQQATLMELSLPNRAMRYAINLSLSRLSPPAALQELWYGSTFFKKVKQMAQNPFASTETLIEIFDSLKEKIFHSSSPSLVFSCETKLYELLAKNDFYALTDHPCKNQKSLFSPPNPFSLTPLGILIPSPVAFSALGYQTIGYMHEASPFLFLGAELMENLYLHKEIREKGGAYGSGAVFSPTSGQFYFYSYRDPHIQRSFDAFRASIQTIASQKFSQEDLDEAKLGVLQEIDAPTAPGARGFLAFDWLRSKKEKELRASFRKKILEAKCEEVALAIQNHLLKQIDLGVLVSFANKDLLERENKKLVQAKQIPLSLQTL